MDVAKTSLCREAYELPTLPPDFIEFGDEIENWDEVRARAESVQRLRCVPRPPWTAVYRVQLAADRVEKFYLVQEG